MTSDRGMQRRGTGANTRLKHLEILVNDVVIKWGVDWYKVQLVNKYQHQVFTKTSSVIAAIEAQVWTQIIQSDNAFPSRSHGRGSIKDDTSSFSGHVAIVVMRPLLAAPLYGILRGRKHKHGLWFSNRAMHFLVVPTVAGRLKMTPRASQATWPLL